MANTDQTSSQQVKIEKGNALLGTLVIVTLAVALLALVGFLFLKPKSDLIEGQAEATSVRISGKLPGRVMELYVEEGQAVKAGDPVVIIEAMKMEIPVVAPQDGTVASIDVAVGDSIEAGAVLATMN